MNTRDIFVCYRIFTIHTYKTQYLQM